jgi:hypothetical protein
MTVTWELLFVLPDAAFREPIESEYLALVPSDDSRLKSLCKQHSTIARLVGRFTDQFGRQIKPSALLVRSDAPRSVLHFYAVASFRSVVALSSVTDAWTMQLGGGNAGYPLWSDFFDLYPFAPRKDYQQLTARSVASWEIDKPDNFCGQRAPHLPTGDRLSFGLDKVVLDSCLKAWRRRFVAGRKEWKSRALFRSLEIACQAAPMPAIGTREPTIHDAGLGISLWVSAFEILKHRRGDRANLLTVVTLMKGAGWRDDKLKARRYVVKYRGKRHQVNYACKLYAELYKARCDFLHGNPVAAGNLFPSRERKGPILLHCAPLIYRVALLEFLGVGTGDRPSLLSLLSLNRIGEYVAHWRAQDNFEKALRACQDKAGTT